MTSEQLRSTFVAGSPPRRHPLEMIVDRPRRQAALALTAAWLAFVAGLVVGGEVVDVASFVIGGASGAALVWVGFAAASRCRTLPIDADARWVRLALLALGIGAGLGAANLAANGLIASADPALRALLVERFGIVAPKDSLIAAPLVEEIVVRLFLLSALTWVLFRFTKRAGLAFALALAGSSVFFALLHLDRPMPDDATLASYYRAALVVKYTLAAVPMGWIFWRWGLPYAILCHAASNAAHIALEDFVF